MTTHAAPPFAFLSKFTVAQFYDWKVTFEKSASARKQAGILGHHINRGAENANQVYLYLPAADQKSVETFLSSPELMERMKHSGMVGEPMIAAMKPIENAVILDRATAGCMIMAEVEDFAAWRQHFDGAAALRKQHGVIGHAVNQLVRHPNTVVIYEQAETIGALHAMFASPDIKTAMKHSGLKGHPSFEFVEGTGPAVMY